MLTIEDLSVAYGAITAVREVSLAVETGQMVALVGPNGAGKSTVLSAIVGLRKPASGSIRLEGESIVGLAPDEAATRGIALVPEGRHVFTTLSVAENLMLGQLGQRRNPDAAKDLAHVFERFPVLARYRDHTAAQLSGGEQQQLVIARALLSRPRLLVLDEPSLGLAPKIVDLVFKVLDDLRSEGLTILLVEQNARRAVAVADHSYVLRSGSLVGSGTKEMFASGLDVSSMYLGRGR